MNRLNPEETSVFVLAAGQGKRMRPLTNSTPKPLLRVGHCSLIEHHLNRIKELGFRDVVINVDYLGDQIQSQLGDGSVYGLSIRYSDESDTGALETAGGIKKAFPLIKSECFLCINADIFTDFQFDDLLQTEDEKVLAQLVLVNNPDHNQAGDFRLFENGQILENRGESLTFSGISLLSKALFQDLPPGKQPLAPLLRKAIKQQKVIGQHHRGEWDDIGTPERLDQINQRFNKEQ